MARARLLAALAFFLAGAAPAVGSAPGALPPRVSAAVERAAVERFRKMGLPVYCGGPGRRFVALTFDDGPSRHTPWLLGLLRRAQVRATFFVVGSNLHSARLARYLGWEARSGVIGDHTWTHPLLTTLTPAQIAFEIGETKRVLSRATHMPVLLFRPPYDERDPTVDRIVRKLRLVEVLWNIDPRDWATRKWEAIGVRVLAGLHPGAIVILHETRPQTLTALKNIILPALTRDKLAAVSIPDPLALDPPSRQQLRKGYAGCNA